MVGLKKGLVMSEQRTARLAPIPGSGKLGAGIVLVAVSLALASCTTKKDPPACPPVYILSDTSKITKYRPGPGHDLTDVDVEAEIVGFHGECKYKAKEGGGWDVLVDLQVAIEAKRGPANTTGKTDLSYFIAIPSFYPSPDAKAVFPLTIAFPQGLMTVRSVDEAVALKIPVKANELIDKYEVYLGFQTTPDELERNRRAKESGQR